MIMINKSSPLQSIQSKSNQNPIKIQSKSNRSYYIFIYVLD